MLPYCDFCPPSLVLVWSLLAAYPEPSIPVEMDDQHSQVTGSGFFEHNAGKLPVSPLTTSGVAFFFTVLKDADENAWTACRLEPTAALFNNSTMILCWALDMPAAAEDAHDIAEALGMQSLHDPIPGPPTGDWELVHADSDTFYTLGALRDAYIAC